MVKLSCAVLLLLWGIIMKNKKKSLFQRFVTYFNPVNWKKKTKIVSCIVAVLVIVSIALSFYVPSNEDFVARTSENMQAEIKKDESRTNKQVLSSYNNLFIISYASYSTEGYYQERDEFVGFAGNIYDASEGAPKFVGQMVNYTYRLLGCGENVLHGAKLTIFLTTTSMFFGLILSIFLALGKMSKFKIISKPCTAYIFFFRGTPLMIQLFAIYFMVPGICGFSWTSLFGDVYWGAFFAAWIAFVLNTGAYCAEIVRAAIQSIDKGQHEAAKVLGFTYRQTMQKIILPQSIKRMIPPICNEFVLVLKDASLVFAISLMDITTISKNIMSDGSYLVFIPALIIYLIITAVFTYIFNKIEKKFSVYE